MYENSIANGTGFSVFNPMFLPKDGHYYRYFQIRHRHIDVLPCICKLLISSNRLLKYEDLAYVLILCMLRPSFM